MNSIKNWQIRYNNYDHPPHHTSPFFTLYHTFFTNKGAFKDFNHMLNVLLSHTNSYLTNSSLCDETMEILIGGWLLLLADTIGRNLLEPSGIPAGIMAALIGAPYFIYLLFILFPSVSFCFAFAQILSRLNST